MTHYRFARLTKKLKACVRDVVNYGLDRFAYDDVRYEINSLANQHGIMPIDVVACIQYVEMKVLGEEGVENYDYFLGEVDE